MIVYKWNEMEMHVSVLNEDGTRSCSYITGVTKTDIAATAKSTIDRLTEATGQILSIELYLHNEGPYVYMETASDMPGGDLLIRFENPLHATLLMQAIVNYLLTPPDEKPSV
jgi:hypothetical protein